jgi:hypothetical protein
MIKAINGKKVHTFLSIAVIVLLLTGCAHHFKLPEEKVRTIYLYEEGDSGPVSQYAPAFLVHDYRKEFNRIGKPSAMISDNNKEKIYIDIDKPVYYYMVRTFRTEKDSYTNYIYRIHFPRVPFSLVPYYLTAGKNVGLITLVTVDSKDRPVLLTTVHTCGCYLAIVPTSYLSPDAYPDKWKEGRLKVYGERLPAKLDYSNHSMPRVLIDLRPGVHRVMDIRIMDSESITTRPDINIIPVSLAPVDDLSYIPVNSGHTSFYHSSGPMKGFVKGSVKIWESIFLSPVSLDLFVGTDKIYGDPAITGNKFYTSLKPWNRDSSNMWDFKRFLEFWGWKL